MAAFMAAATHFASRASRCATSSASSIDFFDDVDVVLPATDRGETTLPLLTLPLPLPLSLPLTFLEEWVVTGDVRSADDDAEGGEYRRWCCWVGVRFLEELLGDVLRLPRLLPPPLPALWWW
jgi:hypothetical protein